MSDSVQIPEGCNVVSHRTYYFPWRRNWISVTSGGWGRPWWLLWLVRRPMYAWTELVQQEQSDE